MNEQQDLQVTYVAVGDVRPFASNARTHPKRQVEQIAASITAFGFTNPILVDPDRNIIAGHGRLLGAKKLGLDKVPVITLHGLSEPSSGRCGSPTTRSRSTQAGTPISCASSCRLW